MRSASRAGHTSRQRRSKLGGISAATTNSSVCKHAAHSRVQYRRILNGHQQAQGKSARVGPRTQKQRHSPSVTGEARIWNPGPRHQTKNTSQIRQRRATSLVETRHRPGDRGDRAPTAHPSDLHDRRNRGTTPRRTNTPLGRRLIYVSKVNSVRRSNSGLNHLGSLYSQLSESTCRINSSVKPELTQSL